MPAGFRFVYQETDVWTAYRLDRSRPGARKAGRFMNVVGRLRADASLGASRAEMDTSRRGWSAAYEFNRKTGVRADAAARDAHRAGRHVAAGPLRRRRRAAVDCLLQRRQPAAGPIGVARREIAIRSSLGAGRLAIVQQR